MAQAKTGSIEITQDEVMQLGSKATLKLTLERLKEAGGPIKSTVPPVANDPPVLVLKDGYALTEAVNKEDRLSVISWGPAPIND